MRIAYVCTDPGVPVFGGKGASVHVQSVLKVLVDQGHEVHLVTPRPGGAAMNGVRIHLLPSVPGGPAALREAAAQQSDAQVASVLHQVSPQLVYERYALWGQTATQWAARHDVRSLLEVNAPLIEEQARHRHLVDQSSAMAVAVSALRSASAVLCVSDAVQQWARSTSRRLDGIHVLPNGVDTERIGPASRLVTPADADAFTVGFVGTLKAWHGAEVLVEAIGRLSADPSWRLLLVGDGPMAPGLQRLSMDLGLQQQVEFTGAVPPSEVAAQLHRMDLACAPYPTSDGFYFSPLKIYEYLAAGLPIVASAVGQVPAALGHGAWGRLVPPGDPEVLAGALRQARRDTKWRTRMREEARATAISCHTWPAVVNRALTLVRPEAA